MLARRSSGVLLHPTSLPGPHGIGTLGRSACEFVDFLKAAGQKYWQILPCGPVSRVFDNSPYMSLSAFAGNPLLIDPAQLAGDGLLGREAAQPPAHFSEYAVDFSQVVASQQAILAQAFQEFQASGGSEEFTAFRVRAHWLDDYALFRSLREEFQFRPWCAWPGELVRREADALALWRQRLKARIAYHEFVQFCFFRQWQRVRRYANLHSIEIIGDMPIYVAYDSADVWANQECFLLDEESRLPTHVAGVPPDYFSATGQRWGNPLFVWQKENAFNPSLLTWWANRFRQVFEAVDMVRIDHFRGFESFWSIPAAEETAVNGSWVQGPGLPFFREMQKVIGDLPIIAEDLGVITPEVEALRDALGLPGMKILQFAFDSDAENAYLPHNFSTTNCVVYTGTHDNDTTLGWYFSDKVSRASKEKALRYAHSAVGSPVHWDFIRLAYSSIAALAIVPLQDVLGFGSDCRMNVPSTSSGNWRWRCAARFLTPEVAAALREEALFYNRLPGAEDGGGGASGA